MAINSPKDSVVGQYAIVTSRDVIPNLILAKMAAG